MFYKTVYNLLVSVADSQKVSYAEMHTMYK